MPIDIPPAIVEYARAADAELAPILLAIAYFESGFDPNAVGDNGCSYGLMQFNTCGGMGAGHGTADLCNPSYAFDLAARHIRAQIASGATLYEAIQPWSVRSSAIALEPEIRAQIGGTGAGSTFGGTNTRALLLFGLVLAVMLAVAE